MTCGDRDANPLPGRYFIGAVPLPTKPQCYALREEWRRAVVARQSAEAEAAEAPASHLDALPVAAAELAGARPQRHLVPGGHRGGLADHASR